MTIGTLKKKVAIAWKNWDGAKKTTGTPDWKIDFLYGEYLAAVATLKAAEAKALAA